MSPTKRKTPTKAEAKVHDITGRVKKRIDTLATSAQGRIKKNGAWVAGKVRQAMVKLERTLGQDSSTD